MLKRVRSFQDRGSGERRVGEAKALHQCPVVDCGRQFTRKYTLSEHMKTHTGEKPHVCPVKACGKRFTTSGNLSRHKRLHGFIQPLTCPVEGCVCTFPTDIKLEKHMKFHFGTAVHACDVVGCGKTFSTTGNLNRHTRNYHPELLPPPHPSGPTGSGGSPVGPDEWPATDAKPSWTATKPEEKMEKQEQVSSDTADEGLETLASILQGTELERAEAGATNERSNLLDDIVRFHMADLGFIEAPCRTRTFTR